MKLGYAIVYVDNVPAVLDFYNRAFGLKTRFLHESHEYGELETGPTILGFASHNLGAMNIPGGYARSTPADKPLGMEFALETTDVSGALAKALAAGAAAFSAPVLKPWGQTVAYVRSIEGTLISLCTPIGPPAAT
jgi:predicted enzyme related to lactoylglutathione lyase